MRLRRGTSPTLYDLYQGDRQIGRLCRAPDGVVVLWLDGFLTADDAADAAALAYSGRLAYQAQAAAAGSPADAATRTGSPPWPGGLSPEMTEVAAHPNGSTIHLHLGGVEIAQVRPVQKEGDVTTWSAGIPLGGHNTPEVFLLAATRRMWEAVRRAGRGIVQNP